MGVPMAVRRKESTIKTLVKEVIITTIAGITASIVVKNTIWSSTETSSPSSKPGIGGMGRKSLLVSLAKPNTETDIKIDIHRQSLKMKADLRIFITNNICLKAISFLINPSSSLKSPLRFEGFDRTHPLYQLHF